jgi:uncharacterized protein (DUF1697 family)
MGMKDLAAIFDNLGHRDVLTYIQSGNVVFTAGTKRSTAALADEIEAGIEQHVGFHVDAIVRSRADMERITAACPFEQLGPKAGVVAVTFLAGKPPAKAIASLDPNRSPADEFVVIGSEVYARYGNGIGQSKLTPDYVERRLGVRGTARNWNTVTKLLGFMQD